ncbi:hypothetical protein BC937DRAFT_88330 [Endogone sp. FLAS-F59071]|nr:hypothetical protein BC937DRAFT_88330 [Endogone sp. FLAS-F59071]|eukprot:RUS18789.1 hypothetical protein BC937DRAFT_88330 [Endogone sp. FLAS-F59071]
MDCQSALTYGHTLRKRKSRENETPKQREARLIHEREKKNARKEQWKMLINVRSLTHHREQESQRREAETADQHEKRLTRGRELYQKRVVKTAEHIRKFAAGLSFVAVSRVRALRDLLFRPFSFERLKRIGKCKRLQDRKAEEERLLKLTVVRSDGANVG